MDPLQLQYQALLASHRRELSLAMADLLAHSSWDLQAPALLLRAPAGVLALRLPVGQLGHWIEHLPQELDAFVRLRQQGVPLEEARERCHRQQGDNFAQAWERTQDRHPLVSHDDLSRLADLSRRGFGRTPRQLLVVVQWPLRVTAFLLSGPAQGHGEPGPNAGAGPPGGQPISRDAGDGRTGQVGQHGGDPGGLLR
ncbi:MAG: hypothetical protein VKI42_00485 [Synechococcaceae cyanobacterium]|nr:hypothetical protein [Synechococcaceae cyanobacterium]